MKKVTPYLLGTAVLAATLCGNVCAENLEPGQVDFGSFSPPRSGGQFVEVNLTSSIITLATRFVEKQEPEVAQLLNGLHGVRVNVIGLDDENRDDLEKRTQALRKELDSKGWERIVVARQQDQDVAVYLKTRNKDTVQGLVVTVMDGNKQAVFVNVVGNIKPEQLALVGDRLNIEPLKKLGGPLKKSKDREAEEEEK
jgi:hypothetical protein